MAHFSDPWAANPYLAHQPPEASHSATEGERQVIEAADAVVFVTEMTAELTMRKYPAEWRRKVTIIPHATDLRLTSLTSVKLSGPTKFRLTHTGALYGGQRSGDGLYEALHELQREQSIEDCFELRLVGEMPPPLEAKIESLGVSRMISVATPLYFLPSLAEMDQASALLVIDADLDPSPFLPSKIFDYLIFDRPIVALTPQGSVTERFLAGLGYETSPPNDVPRIKKLLESLLVKWRRGQLEPTAEHVAARKQFDLKIVAERYADLFHEV